MSVDKVDEDLMTNIRVIGHEFYLSNVGVGQLKGVS